MKRAIAIVLMVEGRDLPDDATILSFVQKKIDMSPRYAANITIGLPATPPAFVPPDKSPVPCIEHGVSFCHACRSKLA